MTLRHNHYDLAYEHLLRCRQIPYLATDEAKRSITSKGPVKNFDFLTHPNPQTHWLIDVKGRKHYSLRPRSLKTWVNREDLHGLTQWEQLFGQGYVGIFAFLYWLPAQPPDAVFDQVFCFRERWYALIHQPLSIYQDQARPLSQSWDTLHLPWRTLPFIASDLLYLNASFSILLTMHIKRRVILTTCRFMELL